MGRLSIPNAWCLVRDKESGNTYCVAPTSQPSFFTRKKYEVIGNLVDEEDAHTLIAAKELDVRGDQIAYYKLANRMLDSVVEAMDADCDQLEEMCKDVRQNSGRTCFGHCKSENGCNACATCYADLRETWNLCATTHILRRIANNKLKQPL